MGINRIRLQNGAMGDPRVDARMQQTYQQNIADNQAQQARNEGILQAAANRLFPEGNFQQIRANAPDQATYNIDATADLVRNNPFGIIGEVAAPALTAATSVPYDVIQGIGRAVDQSDVDTSPYAGIVDDTEIPTGPSLSDLGQAIDAENPLSSALERTIGAATPLAERMSGINLGMSSATAAETPTPDAGTDRPTMADVAGPTTDASGKTYYDDGSYTIPGFTRLKNPDGAPGNYNEFMYKGPDGQIYGSETYGAISAGRYPDIYDPSKQTLASGGRVGFQDGTDPNLTARQVAEQNPELNTIREQLFGENYLDDIEQGTGIAQYYTGFGQMPTLDYTPAAAVDTSTPVVDVTQPVVDSGGGGGNAGLSTGGDDDIDYSQNPLTQMITTPTGDTMTVKEAMTTDAAYTGTDQSGLGGADGMSGGQATPGVEFADQNPYGGTGTMDDLGADSFPEYQEPTVANLGSTAPGITDYLEGIDLETGQPETIDTRATEPPSLGFGNAPEADIYQDPIMDMANINQADVIASDANVGFDTPEQTNAINEAFNSVKDLGAAGVDKLRDSLVALGGKVKEGFDNTIEIGGKTIDLGKSLLGGAISLATGVPGVGLLLNAAQPDKYDQEAQGALGEIDMLKTTEGGLTVDKYGKNVQSMFGDYDDYNLERQIDLQEKIDDGTIKEFKEDGSLTYLGQELKDRKEIEQKLNETRLEEAGQEQQDFIQEIEAQPAVQSGSGEAREQQKDTGVASVSTGLGGQGLGGYQTSSGDVYASAAEAAEKGDGGGGSGGGKIVCTMMNDSYGFGSFRNKIWLKHSKDLAPEYQIGYHKIFLPLVKLSKTNKVLKKTLEHIAVHRTIDIRQEARGKVHLLGRVYRKILEPICYVVGKYVK